MCVWVFFVCAVLNMCDVSVQEQYHREQEKLKKEWERAQLEVEEEERKHNEEVPTHTKTDKNAKSKRSALLRVSRCAVNHSGEEDPGGDCHTLHSCQLVEPAAGSNGCDSLTPWKGRGWERKR